MENIIPDYSHVQQSVRSPNPDRLLARVDNAHIPPPFRRNPRFRHRGAPFFHNNYLRRAASNQINVKTKVLPNSS